MTLPPRAFVTWSPMGNRSFIPVKGQSAGLIVSFFTLSSEPHIQNIGVTPMTISTLVSVNHVLISPVQ